MSNIVFKAGTLADLETVQRIAHDTFKEAFYSQNSKENMDNYLATAFKVSRIREELSNPQSHFFLVRSGDLTVGYLKLNTEYAQTEPVENGLEIERIYLLSAYRDRGIGQLMMNKVFEQAELLGKTRLWLGVWEQNKSAIRFYERNGFQKFSAHSFWLGNEEQTDDMMELILKNG